jgi:TRAP-type mannitol/chloroaromatic compound transport system substrate-binding protein
MKLSRRLLMTSGMSIAAPAIARANVPRRWRMVTAWGRNLVGPGITAGRLAQRITAMSAGALDVQIFAAGEIVPALNIFDAVANDTVEMGHAAALFWAGKMPVAPIFTTVPFGLSPVAHAGWIDSGGQELWDALYAPSDVKPLLAGNTGPSSAGWFRKAPGSLAEIASLRIRATGLGGELYHRLGATAITISPGDTYSALERGRIDAAEFLAPANDLALGLNRIAPILVFPGFNKPNGASELLIGRKHWEALPVALKAIVEAAARMEHDLGLAEAHRLNSEAVHTLVASGVTLHRLSGDILERGALVSAQILDELSARDPLSGQIVTSYRARMSQATRVWEVMSNLPPQLAGRRSHTRVAPD